MPLISVIVPVYNVKDYLDECINSVLSQTYDNFELILVDDGSTDNSGDICDEYAKKDNRIIVIHKENGGVASARNTGLNIAKGKYVTFVDSDDWIEVTFLDEAVAMCEYNDLDIFMGGFFETYNTIKSISVSEPINILRRNLCEEEFVELLKNNYIASPWSKLIRRELIDTLEFTDMRFGEDLTFIFTLINKPITIYATPSPYYYYRNVPTSLTKSVDKKRVSDVVTTYQFLLNYCNINNFSSTFLHYVHQRWLSDLVSIQLMILSSKEKIWNKYKLLRVLLSDDDLNSIIHQSSDKYIKRYCSRPFLLICYNRYLKLKRNYC